MHDGHEQTIAAINSGSSSLKFGVFTADAPLNTLARGTIDHIGRDDCRFTVVQDGKKKSIDTGQRFSNVDDAAHYLVDWLKRQKSFDKPSAIGYRVVHGGLQFSDPEIVDEKLITDLEALVPLAPLHLPSAITILKIFTQHFDDIHHVACFDTAFHTQMPFEARHYAIPRYLWEEGIVRYGFHGLSCEYIIHQLQLADERWPGKNIIVAHLGAGSSITAVKNGKSIENTMGFSPAGGLVMNTRAGDIDPGIISYLLEQKKMDAGQVEELFNEKSGLSAIAGTGASMEQLLRDEMRDTHAREAILLYCYHIKKQIGALAAALGGLDTLVFTGGIGENSSVIRQRVCDGLAFLGIALNSELNEANAENISELSSPVQVYSIATNEELVIAMHVKTFIHEQYSSTFNQVT